MRYIKLIKPSEGGETSPNEPYQLLLASQLDANGEWLTDSVQTYESLPRLRDALQGIIATANGIVIRASNHFDPLAAELGLRPLISEWGCL
jgi:hypothetical protein